IVDEGDEILFPGEVGSFLRDHVIDVREVCIRCSEHTSDRGVQRKIEHRDATLVGELVRISIERIGSTSLKPLAKQKTVAKRVDRIGEGVLPAPVQVLDSIDAETIDAVLLKLLRV